jgi:hypothetical protein
MKSLIEGIGYGVDKVLLCIRFLAWPVIMWFCWPVGFFNPVTGEFKRDKIFDDADEAAVFICSLLSSFVILGASTIFIYCLTNYFVTTIVVLFSLLFICFCNFCYIVYKDENTKTKGKR